MKLGISGFGFVGQAVYSCIKEEYLQDTVIYDLGKGIGSQEALLETGVLFCCLPSPTVDGAQDVSCIRELILFLEENSYEGILVIKSTVLSGELETNLNVVFNPEFLNATSANNDFAEQSLIVLGGEINLTRTIELTYRECFNLLNDVGYEHVSIEIASQAKYIHNVYHAYKVSFWHYVQEITKNERKLAGLYAKITDNYFEMSRLCVDGKSGFGGACLTAGTRIRTIDGYKNIEDLVVGEVLLDDKGETEVVKIGSREIDRAIEIKARGRELCGSEDHIHFVYTDSGLKERLLKDVNVGDRVFMPKIINNETSKDLYLGKKNKYCRVWNERVVLDEKICRMLGLFCAEGCKGKYKKKNGVYTHEVSFSIGKRDAFLAEELVEILRTLGLNPYMYYSESMGTYGLSKTYNVRCRSKWLYTFLDKMMVGDTAHNKNIVILDNDLAPHFIGGWLDGDGNRYKGTISGYSRSTRLIESVRTMLLSLGINPLIGKNGEELSVSTRDSVEFLLKYTKRLSMEDSYYVRKTSYKSPTLDILENGWAVKVTSKASVDKRTVHSLETSSKKYIANDMLTHNCFPKDVVAFQNKHPHELTEFMIKLNKRYRQDEMDVVLGDKTSDYWVPYRA